MDISETEWFGSALSNVDGYIPILCHSGHLYQKIVKGWRKLKVLHWLLYCQWQRAGRMVENYGGQLVLWASEIKAVSE